MSDLANAITDVRNTLEIYCDENISEFSDEQILKYACGYIEALEVENSLYEFGMEYEITGEYFDRWRELVIDKIKGLAEGEDITEDDLLACLKEVRN